MKDRITTIADLLMAGAHADARLEGAERATVRRLLQEILAVKVLPDDLRTRIEGFQPASFDLDGAARAFASDPPELKRRLLELVAAVHAADDEYDFAEDEYLHRLGLALGLTEDSFRDLVIEIVDQSALSADLEAVRHGKLPPPLPT